MFPERLSPFSSLELQEKNQMGQTSTNYAIVTELLLCFWKKFGLLIRGVF